MMYQGFQNVSWWLGNQFIYSHQPLHCDTETNPAN